MNHNRPKGTFDYVVVGAGASGSVIAGELSALRSSVSLW
jgi:choline dehydrogenase-like flavoprotein